MASGPQKCFNFNKSVCLYFVHLNTIFWFIKKNPTRCNTVSKFYYSIFIWSSTCFGRHTAHHQEPKTALAASGFSYVEGWWTCSWWTLSGTLCLTTSTNSGFSYVEGWWTCSWWTSGTLCLTTSTNYTFINLPRMKNQRQPVQFRLLMMGGVSSETCWASYKYGIIKFWYIVASCWIFLYELCYDARTHEHQQFFWEWP